MRLIDVPVPVTTAADAVSSRKDQRSRELEQSVPRLVAFQWKGRTYNVARVVDRWRYVGRWWVGEGEWRFVKVETTDGGLFELYFDTAANEWRLYRVYD